MGMKPLFSCVFLSSTSSVHHVLLRSSIFSSKLKVPSPTLSATLYMNPHPPQTHNTHRERSRPYLVVSLTILHTRLLSRHVVTCRCLTWVLDFMDIQ